VFSSNGESSKIRWISPFEDRCLITYGSFVDSFVIEASIEYVPNLQDKLVRKIHRNTVCPCAKSFCVSVHKILFAWFCLVILMDSFCCLLYIVSLGRVEHFLRRLPVLQMKLGFALAFLDVSRDFKCLIMNV
jgi:hypothetical protein